MRSEPHQLPAAAKIRADLDQAVRDVLATGATGDELAEALVERLVSLTEQIQLQTYLFMLGQHLSALPEEKRKALMFDMQPRGCWEARLMRHSFDKDYWDQIWQGERSGSMSSSEPNPHLIREVAGLSPGTAIDAGCGAGAEAIWLATQGWNVTAPDVADAALAYAERRAAAAGLAGQVQWVQADLSTWEPGRLYDLVTTHYAHPEVSQLGFYDRIANWVAPGGTLFIVGHLHLRDRDGSAYRHDDSEPPVSASVTAADITARLDPAVWEIATAQELRRTMTGPGGHAAAVHDVVVRATRRS